jgi:hypothetical protein
VTDYLISKGLQLFYKTSTKFKLDFWSSTARVQKHTKMNWSSQLGGRTSTGRFSPMASFSNARSVGLILTEPMLNSVNTTLSQPATPKAQTQVYTPVVELKPSDLTHHINRTVVSWNNTSLIMKIIMMGMVRTALGSLSLTTLSLTKKV